MMLKRLLPIILSLLSLFGFLIGYQVAVFGATNNSMTPDWTTSSIIISRISPNPKSGEDEWLELYNQSEDAIDIAGLYLGDKNLVREKIPAAPIVIDNTLLTGRSNILKAGEFITFSVKAFKFGLNNTDEELYIIDKDKKTTLFKIGYKTSKVGEYYCSNFNESVYPCTNYIPPVRVNPSEATYSKAIKINEIVPDPDGDDQLGEFIELYNNSVQDQDLIGWIIDDAETMGSSIPYIIKDHLIIPARSSISLKRSQTHLVLNNSQDTVRLMSPDEQVKDLVQYSYTDTRIDQSYSYDPQKNNFVWTSTKTEAAPNIFNSVTGTKEIPDPLEFELSQSPKTEPSKSPLSYSQSVRINELLADPEGDDAQGEYIELYNQGDDPVDLYNWTVQDDLGHSGHPYKIEDHIFIQPHDFILLKRSQTGITLNNSNDSVGLLSPDAKIQDSVSYSYTGSKSGLSFSKNKAGIFEWTQNSTPKSINDIYIEVKRSANLDTDQLEEPIPVIKNFSELTDFGNNDTVKVEGVIIIKLGKLSPQFFYIRDEGHNLLKINTRDKNVLAFQEGDRVSIQGQINRDNNQEFISIDLNKKGSISKIKAKDNITVRTAKLSSVLLNTSVLGRSVSVIGKIIQNNGNIFYIQTSFYNKLKVSISSHLGFKKPTLKKGDMVSIRGILDKVDNVFRILPLKVTDINKISSNSSLISDKNLVSSGDKQSLLINPINSRNLVSKLESSKEKNPSRKNQNHSLSDLISSNTKNNYVTPNLYINIKPYIPDFLIKSIPFKIMVCISGLWFMQFIPGILMGFQKIYKKLRL